MSEEKEKPRTKTRTPDEVSVRIDAGDLVESRNKEGRLKRERSVLQIIILLLLIVTLVMLFIVFVAAGIPLALIILFLPIVLSAM